MNCAEVKPNLEAYALGALDQFTLALVKAHVVECDACRRAALQYAIVAHTLPDALVKKSNLVPPVSLKQNVMAAAQAELDAEVHAHSRAHTQLVSQAKPVVYKQNKPAPVARRGHWLFNPKLWTGALVASVAVILALVTWLTSTHMQLREAISKETAALDQVQSYQLSEAARQHLVQFRNPQLVVMDSHEGSTATGTLTFDANKPYIVFQGRNLPPTELGKQYFLWTMSEGRMQLVARFSPKPNGEALVSFALDKEYPLLKRVIVTRQVSLREIASDEFPSNETILEYVLIPGQVGRDY